jgi:ABC-2 type transport system ATP-binding protein
MVGVLGRFGEIVPCADGGVAARLEGGESDLADVVRALDAEHVRIDHLQLHQPSLDDVFLAKTGRSLEGAGDEEEAGEPASRLAMDTA